MKETEKLFPVDKAKMVEDETALMPSQKTIVIKENGVIEWNGFANIYEILGFIDIHANPDDLKRAIIEANTKKQ